jgi:hypothetical protein
MEQHLLNQTVLKLSEPSVNPTQAVHRIGSLLEKISYSDGPADTYFSLWVNME